MNPRFNFHRILCAIVCIVAMGAVSSTALAQHPWQPQPSKASLMVIHAHPDDEGIFFGGALPYYTQVQNLPTVQINITTGWLNANGTQTNDSLTRQAELREVAWRYGLRNLPIQDFFQQTNWQKPIAESWDRWADNVTDNPYNAADIQQGKIDASKYLAQQIRFYKPDVIITHDFGGEYSHPDHKAIPYATAAAWDLAAGRNAAINDGETPITHITPDGVAGDPWEAKKLYMHAEGPGQDPESFVNYLFHDDWEDVSIDTNGNSIPDKSPRQVANDAMLAYPSQGTPKVTTVYDPTANGGNAWDPFPSEIWGLYRSTVGSDSLSSFTIEGTAYADFARGDFFQNLPEPGALMLFGVGSLTLLRRQRAA